MLSEKAIAEFQAMYKKEFGIELDDQDAQEQGIKLIRLFKIVYRPIKKEWVKEIKIV